MPNGAGTAPEVGGVATASRMGADTIMRGLPMLKKAPPWLQYLLVMLLSTFGGYLGQGVHGVSAADAEKRDQVILEKLEIVLDGQHDLDKRLTRIEAQREVEKRKSG